MKSLLSFSLSLSPSLLSSLSWIVLHCSIIIGSNGSASHPIGHSVYPLPEVMQPGVPQPGVTQPEITQLGVAQLGVMRPGVTPPGVAQPGDTAPRVTEPGVTQPGVARLMGVPQPGVMAQRRVVQQRAPQLQIHNAPQHMTAGFQMYHSKFYTILSKYSIFYYSMIL